MPPHNTPTTMTSTAGANRTAAAPAASAPTSTALQTSKTDPSPSPIEEEWTEPQLIGALAHLEQLQDQVQHPSHCPLRSLLQNAKPLQFPSRPTVYGSH